MWPFKKRKPKILHHDLRSVATVPAQKSFMRPVRCARCGKQFIMDVFGGWAVEWTFKTENGNWRVNDEDLENAVDYYHSKPAREWIQLGDTDVCEGREG